MSHKISVILILIALVSSVLLSGCIDDRNLQVGVKYPILNLKYEGDNFVHIKILDNNTIKSVDAYLINKSADSAWVYHESATVAIDNESYLEIIEIWRTPPDSMNRRDRTYSKIHLTKEDLKTYLKS